MTDGPESSVQRNTAEEMACPACKARQVWSDQCRRCRCDLSLLRRWHGAGEAVRRRCLDELSRGRSEQALEYARRYSLLAGRQEAARLLAVCHLFCGNWAETCATLEEKPDCS